MNTDAENGYEDDEEEGVVNGGYGDWEQPSSNRGLLWGFVAVVLVVVLVFGGLWVWRTVLPVDHRARALEFLAVDDYASAIVDLKTVVKENPEDAEMRWLLGNAYLELEQPNWAADYLQEAFDLGFREPTMVLALARTKLLIHEYEDALKLYREWSNVKSDVDAAAWEVVRGRSLLNLGRQEKAVEAFLRALKYDPDSTKAKWGLAQSGLGADLSGLSGDEIERALSTGLEEPETWILRGEMELAQGNFKDSQAAFEKAVELGPEEVYALAGLVRVLIATNQLDEAQESVSALARQFPYDPMSAYVRALYSSQRQDYERALDSLDIVLEHEPNHAMSILLLGEVQLAMGSVQLALDNLGLFHRMVPGSVLGRKRLASAFIDSGKPDSAVELLEPLVDQVHKDPEIATMLATAYSQMGDKRRAKAYQSLSFKLNSEGGGTRLALQHLGSGDTQEAIDELQQVISESPEEVQGRIVLAVSHLQRAEKEQALEISSGLLKALPDDPQVQYLHGTVLELSGDAVAAVTYYDRTLELDPQFHDAILALARIEMDSGRREEAKSRIEGLLDKDRDNATAQVWLAQMALQEGDSGQAINRLESARTKNRDALQARVMLADIYLQRRNVDGALAVSREIVKLAPNHPVGNYLLANALVMAGDPEEGLRLMEMLEESKPDNLKLKWRMVEAQEQAGDNVAVHATLNRVLAVDENNPRALVKLAMLERNLGNSGTALKLAGRLTEHHPESGMGYLIQGQLLMDDRNYLVAADFLERAFGLNDDSVTLSRLYAALYGAGEAEKAEELMSDWLDENPTDNIARLAIADEAQKMGDTARAVQQYEWVIRREDDNVPVLVLLAKGYHELDDRRDLKTAQQAYELAPDDIFAKHLYAWLLVDTGLSERGAELLRDVVKRAPNNPAFRYHLAVALHDSGMEDAATLELRALAKSKAPFAEQDEAKALMNKLGVKF